MFNLSAHTTDDRGKRVPVFSMRAQPAARYQADPRLAEIVARLAETDALGLNERITGPRLLMLAPFLIAPIAVMAAQTLMPGLPSWMGITIMIGSMGIIAPISIAIGQASTAHRVRATLLLEGRCPCCAYPLAGLPAESDGRIRCPECNAAWTAACVGVPSVASPRAAQPATILRAYTTRASAVDALDRVIPLRDPLLRDLDAARAESLGPDRLSDIRSAIRARTLKREVTAVLAWLFLMLLVTGTQFMVAFLGPGPAKPIPAAMGALFTLVFLMQIYRVLTYRSRSTALPAAKVLIEHNLCPSCAGDLTASPDSPLLTCPTCRAAWKPDGP